MNILVTGANGQLGTCLRREVKNSANRFFFTDIEELDITDQLSIKRYVEENSIDIIVNCAAYTNVDKAEKEPDKASLLNVEAVGNLALAMKERDGVLIHISTDYVFGGNNNNIPYREDQPTNPTGVYGTTKLKGERILIESGCPYIIIRTSWLYSEVGRNFVKTIMHLMKERDVLNVVFDQVGTPTYAGDLAALIHKILESADLKEKEGIYHYANEGVASWYDFAVNISRLTRNEIKIKPCHSDEFPSDVVRPFYSVLDKTKIKETFATEIPYWVDSLEKCIQNLKEENL